MIDLLKCKCLLGNFSIATHDFSPGAGMATNWMMNFRNSHLSLASVLARRRDATVFAQPQQLNLRARSSLLFSITNFWTIRNDVFIYESRLRGWLLAWRTCRRAAKVCANILKIWKIIPNDKYININYNPDKTFNLLLQRSFYPV